MSRWSNSYVYRKINLCCQNGVSCPAFNFKMLYNVDHCVLWLSTLTWLKYKEYGFTAQFCKFVSAGGTCFVH